MLSVYCFQLSKYQKRLTIFHIVLFMFYSASKVPKDKYFGFCTFVQNHSFNTLFVSANTCKYIYTDRTHFVFFFPNRCGLVIFGGTDGFTRKVIPLSPITTTFRLRLWQLKMTDMGLLLNLLGV